MAIDLEHLHAVELRVATVRSVRPHPAARQPAFVLELDLGPLGTRTSSAQLTADYTAEELVGTQVVCVANLPARRVAGVKSEVLVLAAVRPAEELGGHPDDPPRTRLLRPDAPVPDGSLVR